MKPTAPAGGITGTYFFAKARCGMQLETRLERECIDGMPYTCNTLLYVRVVLRTGPANNRAPFLIGGGLMYCLTQNQLSYYLDYYCEQRRNPLGYWRRHQHLPHAPYLAGRFLNRLMREGCPGDAIKPSAKLLGGRSSFEQDSTSLITWQNITSHCCYWQPGR